MGKARMAAFTKRAIGDFREQECFAPGRVIPLKLAKSLHPPSSGTSVVLYPE